MEYNENETKADLLKKIKRLEKEVDNLSSEVALHERNRFRDRYTTRILDALPDMLTILDHDANIVELVSSPNTSHIEGATIENIVHRNVKDILPPKSYESIRIIMDKVIQTGISSIAQHELVINSVVYHFENHISKLDDEYLLCICRDISHQWEIERAKEEQQRALTLAQIKAEEADKLKSAFLANMSHEVRTPLNAIVGFSKIIVNGDSTERGQYADIIEKNSHILLNLFNDILDLSALEASSLELSSRKIRLLDICCQLYQLYRDKTQGEVELIFDGGDADTYILGDLERLTQVINNLLNNAIKFTIQGEIHYGFHQKGNIVEFYVKDSGIGIPSEKAATIFQRFRKINDFVQGTGLGLTLCRMLIEKMGGRIWLRSKEKEGTTFYFTLPCLQS
ncbi:PAS domain-containing sensor histidine kinase [Bacteroides reticulotermitis]|uniref:histidine kinase n=2 Tax=Bacteroides reticulotermitis TaxID=1133319 RepID=W4V0B5_9BACE|nr:PAS domain-containing sensor histidine kinase [Bacteroides reticulotermitis]MBB4044318.1 K+-sensing histidine kinase KdpD [Bacteroides reticulotermitis]GAE86522.1 two-component system sensor histidine kinase [Bacteroides reticulotermitis JCM 10512]